MSAIGVKIDQFDMPVCNSFQPKLLEHELCYEINVNDYFKGIDSNDLKTGLTFILDYNEDRQILEEKNDEIGSEVKYNRLSQKGR